MYVLFRCRPIAKSEGCIRIILIQIRMIAYDIFHFTLEFLALIYIFQVFLFLNIC